MTEGDSMTPVQAALVLLSLITGDDWDEVKLMDTAEHVRALAERTLAKQGVPPDDIPRIVEERWERFTAPIPAPDPELSAAANLAIAPAVPEVYDAAARLRARIERKAAAAESEDAAAAEATA